MIIGISDGVGMTNIINDKNLKEAQDHYKNFYCKHSKILLEDWKRCDWKICKTTGDGLFFYSENNVGIDYSNYLQSIIALYHEINDDTQPSRLFVYACDSSKIVKGSAIEDDNIKSFIENDLFGHELNLGFRLLGLASGPFLFTEDKFLEKIYKDEVSENPKKQFRESGFTYTPIPITFLKGIKEIGFRSKTYIDAITNETKQKKPRWIWQIQKN